MWTSCVFCRKKRGGFLWHILLALDTTGVVPELPELPGPGFGNLKSEVGLSALAACFVTWIGRKEIAFETMGRTAVRTTLFHVEQRETRGSVVKAARIDSSGEIRWIVDRLSLGFPLCFPWVASFCARFTCCTYSIEVHQVLLLDFLNFPLPHLKSMVSCWSSIKKTTACRGVLPKKMINCTFLILFDFWAMSIFFGKPDHMFGML